MTNYDGHQITFEEAPLLLGIITGGYLHSGYVELDSDGAIMTISVNNVVHGIERWSFGDRTPEWEILHRSLVAHLASDLSDIQRDLDPLDPIWEYGTYDARAI
jgi:hypothetical protein